LTFTYKGVRRLANNALRQYLKDNWAGDVDIMAMRDNDVRGYLKKYLGKYSHVEDALRRAKRDWSKDGDMRHKDADCKKLWTNYYCGKLKIRRFTSNVKKLAEKEAAQPPDLVNNMNKFTKENKPQTIRRVLLPWWVKFNPAFEPYNGKVDPDSREYLLAQRFLNGEKEA